MDPKDYRPPTNQLEIEARAEAERARFVAESKQHLGDRCPECGALGSLQDFEGDIRCIDCDEVVHRKTKLSGFGRR